MSLCGANFYDEGHSACRRAPFACPRTLGYHKYYLASVDSEAADA